MPNELKVTITGDAASAEQAFQRAAQATTLLEEAQRKLGAAADAGNASAKQIIATYEREAVQAEQLATAYQAAATEATTFATTQETVSAASTHMVPQFAAASGALRELQGNFDHNIRAAERFLSTTLGLGPALQAAFPVVGALAFGAVLADVGERLGKFIEDAEALGRELGTDWLTAAIGQMTGLGKAVEQTDKQIEEQYKELDRIVEKQRSNSVELARIMGGSSAADAEKALQLQQQKATLDALLPSEKARIDLLSKEAQITTNQYGQSTDNPGGLIAALDAKKQLEKVQNDYNISLAKEAELDSEIFNLVQKMTQEQDKKKPKKEKEDPNDRVEFETNRLLAEEAIKDEKDITKAIEKANEERGRAVLQAARDSESAARESERVDEEVGAEGVRLYNEYIKEKERAAKQEAELEAKLRRDQERQEEESLRKRQQQFMKFSTTVGNEFNSGVDAWLRGGQRMSAVWTEMLDRMALSTINTLLTMGERWLAHEIMVRVLHMQTTAINTATDASAKAAQLTTSIAANEAVAQSNVAVAATLALAETANPAYASAIYAMGEGFATMAAFDTGTDYVPKTGMAVLHEGEKVLDRDSNRQITRALTGGGVDGRPSAIHFHDHSNWNGIDGASVEGMFRSHGASMRREVMRQLRLSNRI